MTPEVEKAVEELRTRFPDTEVDAVGTGDGGATVTIARVGPGPAYVQRETWMGFTISYLYPSADIYPLFASPDLTRVDGEPHGEGISLRSFQGAPALQLSRRSNRLNPATDTAALKVAKVLQWLWAH